MNQTRRKEEANKKMEALNKAYADIIFSTTKEAAAKIMVSERKAYGYQKQMFGAKEEAVNMLVRMKTMTDSKIAEAEMTSFSQRRKIQELEAKLHEAGDVANYLRTELREVKEELQKLKSNLVQPLDKKIVKGAAASDEDAPQVNKVITSESILLYPLALGPATLSSSNVKDARLYQSHAFDHCSSAPDNVLLWTELPSDCPEENFDAGKPDLSLMIERTKEPQLYRSGCTQRVHAFDKNQLNGKSSSPVHTDNQSLHKKRNSFFQENEASEGACISVSTKAGNMHLTKKNTTRLGKLLQIDNCWDKAQGFKFVRIPSRKRGARSRKARTTFCTNQMMKSPVGASLTTCQISTRLESNIGKLGKDPSRRIEQTEHKVPSVMGSKLGCPADILIDTEVLEARSIQNSCNEGKVDKSYLTTHEKGADRSEVPDSISSLRNVQVQLMNSNSQVDENCEKTNRAPSQTTDDKFLKYTFQRKRKRTSLSILGQSVSLENNTSKKKPTEIQSNGPEPLKSRMMVESSRDDRQLMQVARQVREISPSLNLS
ncbi:hypothetical protein IFM89_005898 [Coptis chinensis]|uniref:Uncharacterized protein n=1 Tax=Coptis chinensis TaxID=261450 RepID=A0A835HU75_9MAGN|nr:hypothetical protein IFM89_005898 [Coptis chinensis]